MSSAVAAPARRPQRRPRLRRLLLIGGIVVAIGAVADLLGWNIRGWFSQLWDVLSTISIGYVVAGIALSTLQTVAVAVAWYWILRVAYGAENVSRKQVLASYATAVALNTVLPANLGTLVSLFMFTAIVAGATFSGILGGYVVEKIFFTVAGAFVYLYLFLSVGGSFDIKFSWVHEHPWATVGILAGAVVLIVLLVQALRRKIDRFWQEAKQGGQVLVRPRTYFLRVAFPQFVSWAAGLGVIAVFLAAYGIPVSLHTVMRVVGGNSIANVTSVTPGGVGVNQAFNVASLSGVTDATTATAYSVAQQLVTTAWAIVFAIATVAWGFGWSEGKSLVAESYESAKRKAEEEKAKRQADKAAKRARRHPGHATRPGP